MPENRPRGRTAIPRGISASAPLSGLRRAKIRVSNTDESRSFNRIRQPDHRKSRSIVPIGWIHPPCTGCQGEVHRRERERPGEWAARHTCSEACAVKRGSAGQVLAAQIRWAAAFAAHPPCAVCGGAVDKKSSRKEPFQKFLDRATCSPACGKIHQAAQACGPRGPHEIMGPYRKGELVSVDFAGGFGGRQTWVVRPDPRPLPAMVERRSMMSASIGWLL